MSKIAIFGYLAFKPPDGGFPWDDLHKFFCGCQRVAKKGLTVWVQSKLEPCPKEQQQQQQWMTKVPSGLKTLRKISTGWVGHTSLTEREQTDDRKMDR